MTTPQAKIAAHAKSAEAVWGEAYNIIWKVINQKKLQVGAEIGVAFGGHSEAILANTRARLYCVDPYKHIRGYDDPMNKSQTEFDELYTFATNRLKKYKRRVVFVRKKSTDAIRHIKEELGFVYIDGDHSYEGVKEDIANWFFKVKEGGIIGGHDYNHPNFPGVKKAVDAFFGRFEWRLHTHQSGVWWVEKKSLPISFVIPAFNAEKTIVRSIESIVKGNYCVHDEIVIVDDSSTDLTAKMIKKLQRQHRGIRLVSHAYNRGGGASRNTGVRLAKNPLIFCLDADNVLLAGSIAKLKKYLLQTSADVASFSKVKFFNPTNKSVNHSWYFPKMKYHLDDYLQTFQVPGASGNYLYTKKSHVLAGGYPEFAGALDAWGFGLRQVATGQDVVVLPKSKYLHRVGHNSYWVRDSKKSNMSLKALMIIWRYFNQITFIDQCYILTKGLFNWFENIPVHPIHLRRKNT